MVIKEMILKTASSDPFAIGEMAMSFPGLPMLGCHHAYIAGGALMAALKNQGACHITDNDIEEVFDRIEKQAHGGFCGLTGVCGITPAIGACFAVLTGSKCGLDAEQRTTMEIASMVSLAITQLTGPSCCKAYVRGALKVAVEFFSKQFNMELVSGKHPACRFSSRHPHGCRKGQCPFYQLQEKL